MLRRLLRNRYVLPGALLAGVGLMCVLTLSPGALAATKHSSHAHSTTSTTVVPQTGHAVITTPGGTHFVNTKPTVTPTAPACKRDAESIGYKAPPNSGSPQDSSYLKCSHGKVVEYGTKQSIIYKLPPSSYIAAGHRLFEENCSSCHLSTAQGSAAAPSLRGVGPATVNFWVTTGRMPAAAPL